MDVSNIEKGVIQDGKMAGQVIKVKGVKIFSTSCWGTDKKNMVYLDLKNTKRQTR